MAKTPTKKWNPRYVRFAEVHGRTPEEQLEYDEEQWPGGRMCGFICWMSQAKRAYLDTEQWVTCIGPTRSWREFKAPGGDTIWDQKDWDRWLSEYNIKLEDEP